jgi:tRNA-specific 2-thiouridylase
VERRGDRLALLAAADPTKDQSYFLHGLGQDALADVLFPVGGLPKPRVRALAARAGLENAEKPESQEICFVTRGAAADFVALRAPDRVRSGEVVSTSGEVLGHHAGVHGFTVGQRRGLGVTGPEPRYVVRLEPATARVVVGSAADASRDLFRVADVSWVSGAPPAGARAVRVKVRHRHEGEQGTVSPMPDGGAEVALAAPVRGVAPGQAAVFYDGDEVVGGGRIV